MKMPHEAVEKLLFASLSLEKASPAKLRIIFYILAALACELKARRTILVALACELRVGVAVRATTSPYVLGLFFLHHRPKLPALENKKPLSKSNALHDSGLSLSARTAYDASEVIPTIALGGGSKSTPLQRVARGGGRKGSSPFSSTSLPFIAIK